jgi:hypothetical protein
MQLTITRYPFSYLFFGGINMLIGVLDITDMLLAAPLGLSLPSNVEPPLISFIFGLHPQQFTRSTQKIQD